MAIETQFIWQFAIIAAALWLFIHLAFGIGSYKDALLLALLGLVLIPLLQGQGMQMAALLLALGGLLAMQMYGVNFISGAAILLVSIIISLYLFPFSS